MVTALRTVPEEYSATGTVRARLTATISARTMGHIRELRVQPGDSVQAGQILAVLDSRDADNAVRLAEQAQAEAQSNLPEVDNTIAAAQAQLDLAQATFARMKDLFEKKSITNQEFDEAQARVRMAQAQRAAAQAKREQVLAKVRQTQEARGQAALQKTYSTVEAPFAGLVVERKAEPGVLASPGMPLLILEQAGSYRLEAAVEESKLRAVRVGERAEIRLDALTEVLSARVGEVVPSIDPASRTFLVKLDLPATRGLRSGLFGRAVFRAGERQALLIPAAAIEEQGQLRRAYVVEEGTARSRLVTLGARFGDDVEVLTGLRAGERVITERSAALQDGARITGAAQ